MKMRLSCCKNSVGAEMRQLRNVAEQISVLETNRHNYNYTTVLLTQQGSNLPSVIKETRKVKMISQQREILYKVL
jgi:hypothetical protein